ncbi:MAG TPA: DUF2993 domain-containing protein [Jatrophihabitantaceae bacterium]|nr:DUF2993 domain-containing protein [Jatrophihabitantaceae bacterium]
MRAVTMRRILVVLLVLAGLLVVADRAALAIAERAAATTIQHSEQLRQRPNVTIAGFPFLNQLVTGHYGKVRVRASEVLVGEDNRRLRISHLDVTLRHVHLEHDFASGRAKSATASALIGYHDLSDALNTRFGYAGGGRVRATTTISEAGVELPASATAVVRLEGDTLTFADTQVEIGDVAVPPEVTSYFTGLFSDSISLAGLPFDVHVQQLTARADGVHVTLTAHGLTFSR